MKEFPDDELDKLFRKSAEELDSNFDPQDWNALKKRLDKNDGRTTGTWLKKWWPAGMLAMLIIAGLTTYLLTDTNKNEVNKINQVTAEDAVLNEKRSSAKKVSEIVKGEKEDDLSKSENNVQDNTERNTGTDKAELKTDNPAKADVDRKTETNNEIVKKDKSKQPEDNLSESLTEERYRISKNENQKALPRRGSKAGGVYLEPNRSIGRKGDGAIISKNDVEDRFEKNTGLKEKSANPVKEAGSYEGTYYHTKNSDVKEDISNVIISKTEMTEKGIQAGKAEPESRLNFPVTALKSKAFVWKQAGKLPIVEETKMPQVSKTEEVENSSNTEKQPEPKFAIRFGYSPDISSTGLKNLTKPGTAVSLLIEYSFLPKLYFQTGLIRSSKVYNAKAGEYEWPSSWNDQSVRPTSVDAICKVIEIPLNLRFDITQNERSRWFVGAGASSYYMQNEKYDYKYPPHSYNILWKDYETSTGWYWLSHLNASAGFEYRFSKTLSLLAEPYVRVPIKRVGYGKVDLFSAGMWFSLRYTPVFKR